MEAADETVVVIVDENAIDWKWTESVKEKDKKCFRYLLCCTVKFVISTDAIAAFSLYTTLVVVSLFVVHGPIQCILVFI